MPSINQVAARDERMARSVRLKNPITGAEADLEVAFYPNRITMAAARSVVTGAGATDQLAQAEQTLAGLRVFLCRVLASWDLTGPLHNADGMEIVADGEPIPLQPEVVAHVPDWIVTQLIEHVAKPPKPNGSPPSPAL